MDITVGSLSVFLLDSARVVNNHTLGLPKLIKSGVSWEPEHFLLSVDFVLHFQ